MPSNERIDRLIRDKLGNLQETPPDFVWDNIVKNNQNIQSEGTINQMDQAIKYKLNELTKEPPAYVWNHIQYYLELITIWQNIKRVLLWQRAKRTFKAILIAIAIFLAFEYPLNDYLMIDKGITQTNKQVSENSTESKRTPPVKHLNRSQHAFISNDQQVKGNQHTEQHSDNLIAQRHHSSISYSDDDETTPPINNNDFTGQTADTITNTPQYTPDETRQMISLPPINIQVSSPTPPSKLKSPTIESEAPKENVSIPLWQVDIGTQFSLMVNQYLFQSLFSNEYITVSPGLISSFYFGRIIPAKNHIYRVGILYGGFDSKVAVLIDGRWNKETLESRYLGISGSIGKLLLTTGYRRWIDGWINTSVIYYIHHMYSSEILRINPPANKIGILTSVEINYVRGIKRGNMFLFGGRINVLPVNILKQQGLGKFINLELHVGMRL